MMKKQKIEIRLSDDEKKRIVDKAKQEGFQTITAFIKASTERYVSLNIDTSEYNQLLQETRKIGRNINSLIRDIRFSSFFTDKDIMKLEAGISNIESILKEERKNIDSLEDSFVKLKPHELEKMLEESRIEKPLELIFDNLIEMIKSNLLEIIDIMKHDNWGEQYVEIIYIFIYSLLPDLYSLEEIESINNIIYKYYLSVKNKLVNPVNKFSQSDFTELQAIIEENEKYLD